MQQLSPEKITLSDCQAALRVINSTTINLKLVKEYLEKLKKLDKENKILLPWMPAQQGIETKEKANDLARKEADTALTGP